MAGGRLDRGQQVAEIRERTPVRGDDVGLVKDDIGLGGDGVGPFHVQRFLDLDQLDTPAGAFARLPAPRGTGGPVRTASPYSFSTVNVGPPA